MRATLPTSMSARPARRCAVPALGFALLSIVVLSGDTGSAIAQNPAAPTAPAPLVSRARVQLNLAGADLILTQCKAKAVEMKLNLNIAVADDGGHLLAFARMD